MQLPDRSGINETPSCSVELRTRGERENSSGEHHHLQPPLVSALVLGGTFINLSCVLFEHCMPCHAIPEFIINDYFLFQLC